LLTIEGDHELTALKLSSGSFLFHESDNMLYLGMVNSIYP